MFSLPDTGNVKYLWAQSTTLAQAATIQSLSFYVKAASGSLMLGIYDATGPNGGPGALKASTNSFTAVTGWNTANVTSPVSLAAGAYWLAFIPSSSSITFMKSNASGACRYQNSGFGSLPKTFWPSPTSCASTIFSLYGTLATSSGGGGTNGVCGSANGVAVSTAPTSGLCTAGSASAVGGSGPWNWSCAGSNGGTTASCSAPLQSASSGGSDPTSGVLPSYNDAYANWKNAGLLSVGGIPIGRPFAPRSIRRRRG